MVRDYATLQRQHLKKIQHPYLDLNLFYMSHFYPDWVTLIISGTKGSIKLQAIFGDHLDQCTSLSLSSLHTLLTIDDILLRFLVVAASLCLFLYMSITF